MREPVEKFKRQVETYVSRLKHEREPWSQLMDKTTWYMLPMILTDYIRMKLPGEPTLDQKQLFLENLGTDEMLTELVKASSNSKNQQEPVVILTDFLDKLNMRQLIGDLTEGGEGYQRFVETIVKFVSTQNWDDNHEVFSDTNMKVIQKHYFDRWTSEFRGENIVNHFKDNFTRDQEKKKQEDATFKCTWRYFLNWNYNLMRSISNESAIVHHLRLKPNKPLKDQPTGSPKAGLKPTPAEKPKGQLTCDGCGRNGHAKEECQLKTHPDFNRSVLKSFLPHNIPDTLSSPCVEGW
jgi:hypothetical protein